MPAGPTSPGAYTRTPAKISTYTAPTARRTSQRALRNDASGANPANSFRRKSNVRTPIGYYRPLAERKGWNRRGQVVPLGAPHEPKEVCSVVGRRAGSVDDARAQVGPRTDAGWR